MAGYTLVDPTGMSIKEGAVPRLPPPSRTSIVIIAKLAPYQGNFRDRRFVIGGWGSSIQG